jgi:flagellin
MALASGSRVSQPGNDPAGFAISESLRGQLSGLKQARRNSESAISMLQAAEGGLAEQNNILVRLRELAIYAASDTIGDDERGFLNGEYQQLTQEFDRIAKATRFANKQLLTGSGEEFSFQVGAYSGEENTIEFTLEANTTASDVGIDGLAIDDQDAALDTLEDIDGALLKLAEARSSFGAVQGRLQFAADHLAVQAQNIDSARSQIADADIAEEASKLATNQIIQDSGIAVLAAANMNTARVAKLIN